MEEDLHKGHRARLREQYLASDGKGFSDHLLLELLLSYAIPRKDVNPLAHRLLNEFGSLERVLGATKSELSGIDGVGPQTVTLLQLVFDLHRPDNIYDAVMGEKVGTLGSPRTIAMKPCACSVSMRRCG